MIEEDFFLDYRIAVIGLGLMGGSLALRLNNCCKSLIAVDPDRNTRKIALEDQIVEKISGNPADIIPEADVIVLAAPVTSIIEIIQKLPDLHPGSPIVIDLGSTKMEICQALNDLPPRFEPIGGHPMCGKAVGGLIHSEADLFEGAPFALTPLERTTERARKFASELVSIIGSVPVWVGPETHDRWVAATSHLPYILAAALTLATPFEASHLIGPGFRSTTRLAGSPSSVMTPVLRTNKKHVLAAIARVREKLDNIEELMVSNDFSTLDHMLNQGSIRKDELIET